MEPVFKFICVKPNGERKEVSLRLQQVTLERLSVVFKVKLIFVLHFKIKLNYSSLDCGNHGTPEITMFAFFSVER